MGRLKTRLRLIGIVIIVLGGMFIPIGFGVSPKRDLSAFNNLTDMSAFLTWGVWIIGIGVALVVVALLLPGAFEE